MRDKIEKALKMINEVSSYLAKTKRVRANKEQAKKIITERQKAIDNGKDYIYPNDYYLPSEHEVLDHHIRQVVCFEGHISKPNPNFKFKELHNTKIDRIIFKLERALKFWKDQEV